MDFFDGKNDDSLLKWLVEKLVDSMSLKEKVLELCTYSDEQEWFEFKENWFQVDGLGEYVSALSNAAAFHYNPVSEKNHGFNRGDDSEHIF